MESKPKGIAMKFTHLNQQQRYQIEKQLALKKSIRVIAEILGIHRSTLYRELHRGKAGKKYNAIVAHERSLKRRAKSAANHKCHSKEVWQVVKQQLKEEWSPDEISLRLKIAGSEGNWAISHQAIYNWIKRTKSPLRKKLRRFAPAKVWKQVRSAYPEGRESIRMRPLEALDRRMAGHWEGDTIRGKSHHHCIVTLVERKSLFVKLSCVLAKTADNVTAAINQLLTGFPSLSLTLDNGSEFARFKGMQIKAFFADPGKPRQRSRNENTNGLIRQYIRKTDCLIDISNEKIKDIEDRLNHRPRKTLGYRTPHEVLFNLPSTPVAIRT